MTFKRLNGLAPSHLSDLIPRKARLINLSCLREKYIYIHIYIYIYIYI